MKTEHLLYDSGKPDFLTRLLVTPVGLLFLWLVIPLVSRHAIIPAVICGSFSLLFLYVAWLFDTRLYFDYVSQQLVFRDANTFWRSRSISLSGAEAMYIKSERSWLSSWSAIYIRYHGAADRWILRVPPGDPDRVALSISDAIGLPIVQI